MRTLKYIGRRLLALVPQLFLISIITFTLVRMLPGDPARLELGPLAPEEGVELLRHQLRLDEPLPQQYIAYLQRLVQGMGKQDATDARKRSVGCGADPVPPAATGSSTTMLNPPTETVHRSGPGSQEELAVRVVTGRSSRRQPAGPRPGVRSSPAVPVWSARAATPLGRRPSRPARHVCAQLSP